MNSEREIADIGRQLGSEAAEHIARHAEDYCECERQRIELSNQARINALHFEGARLTKRARQIEDRLRLAPLPGEGRSHERKAHFYWFTGIVLTLAAFFFSLIAFGPYRLGWCGILYCLGIALVTPFAIEVFLDSWKSEKVFKTVVTVVFLAALGGGALLAAIRGDLLSQQVQESTPAIVIEGETVPAPPPQNSFYDATHGSLRLLMLFLAVAIDLGAGVAIHRALLLGASSGEDFEKLSQELESIEQRVETIVFEITALNNAPNTFVARFWRDFYRAMLTQTVRQAATKLLGLLLCLLLLGGGRTFAQERLPLNLVVAVDLSASVAAKGQDGTTDFEKNMAAITELLAHVSAGSRVTILGITGNSFAQPDILLRAEVGEDAGYFGERLTAARRQLIGAWRERAVHIAPNAPQTDILGALLVAAQIFNETHTAQRKVIVIFSDMRQATTELNLENATQITDPALQKVQQYDLLADLNSVDVYALGIDAAGRSAANWQTLRRFWVAYFRAARANVRMYSVLREVPNF